MKHLNSFFITLLMMSTVFVGCDEDDPQIKITSISFNSASVEVVEGTTVNLDDILTIEGEDADQADISFESDNDQVVTVSGNTLSAVAVGEATIEATEANTGETATIEVTVVENVVAVTGVTLDEETADLKVGETLQLDATVAPDNATEQGVTWSVAFPADSKSKEEDPTDIATVSDDGLVTAISAGDVVVTAKTKDGDFTASTDISVSNIEVTGITISPDPVEVNINESVQLSATIAPENATVKTVTWSVAMIESAARTSVSEPTVDDYLEIDEDGLLTAKQRCDDCEFTATATATDGEVTETVDVTINYVPVTSITLDPNTPFEVGVDDTYQMAYTYTPENASDPTVTWDLELRNDCREIAIAAPSVDYYAEIDENGEITGHNETGCGIKLLASHPDLNEDVEVNFSVVQYVTGLTILNAAGGDAGSSISFGSGCEESYALGVDVSPEDASNNDVTWSIEDQDYFQINSSGQVSAKTTLPWPFSITFSVMVVADDGSGVASTVEMNFDNSGCD